MDRKNDVYIFLVVTLFIILAVLINPIGNTNSDWFGFASSTAYPGYATPYSYGSVNTSLVFKSASDTATRSVDVNDDIVYRQGYVSYDGSSWTPFDISPSGSGNLNTDWINTKGTVSISFSPAQLGLNSNKLVTNNTYIIIYSCSKNTTAKNWSCHDGWQIIPLNARLNSAVPVLPSINFLSPTPASGSTISSTSQRILANISDGSGIVSSWIDFDKSLILWMRMDGNATDSSAFKWSTTDSGVTYENGLFGRCSSGFTENTKVNVASNLDYASTDMTLSFWLYVVDYTNPSRQNVFGKAYGGDGTLNLEPTGVLNFYFGSSGADEDPYTSPDSQNTVTPGVWEYWALTRNRATRTTQWFKNGVAESPIMYNASVDPLHSTNALQIGDNYVNPLNGKIDQFMIFNRVLSSSEIKALYDSKSNRLDATFNNLANGQHNYTVYAIDGSGNLVSSGTRTFNVNILSNCTAETNASFCSRLGKNCGSVTANDNCSISRTVTSCGSCLSTQNCTNNVCVISTISPPTTPNAYYVATNGNNNNPGTISQPWKSWDYGFNHLAAGDKLYIRGGIYSGVDYMHPADGSHRYGVYVSGISGTSSKHIVVQNYPGETPILDGSAWTITTGSIIGIRLNNCNYWDIKGLTVTNFYQHSDNAFNAPGWWTEDSTHIILDSCVVHDCGDGFEMWGTMDYINYTNCDSYQNHDRFIGDGSEKPGGLANGFYGAIGKGNHVYFNGCRSWSNSDDGWDLFGGAGYVVWHNCWAFSNGDGYGGVTGDGSGFKVGPVSVAETGDQRLLYNCLAVNNKGITGFGFDQNMGVAVPIKIYNGLAYNNEENFQFYGASNSVIRNSISFGGASTDEFRTNIVDHNSWQNGLTASAADFSNLDVSQLSRSRREDGSLPDITFGHLVQGSDLIDQGVDVGLPYSGKAPDIGVFENP